MSWNDPNWLAAWAWYHTERRGRTLIVEPRRTAQDIHNPHESVEAFYNRVMREHHRKNGPTEVEIIAKKMRERNK